jgi:hypothetical protein
MTEATDLELLERRVRRRFGLSLSARGEVRLVQIRVRAIPIATVRGDPAGHHASLRKQWRIPQGLGLTNEHVGEPGCARDLSRLHEGARAREVRLQRANGSGSHGFAGGATAASRYAGSEHGCGSGRLDRKRST